MLPPAGCRPQLRRRLPPGTRGLPGAGPAGGAGARAAPGRLPSRVRRARRPRRDAPPVCRTPFHGIAAPGLSCLHRPYTWILLNQCWLHSAITSWVVGWSSVCGEGRALGVRPQAAGRRRRDPAARHHRLRDSDLRSAYCADRRSAVYTHPATSPTTSAASPHPECRARRPRPPPPASCARPL